MTIVTRYSLRHVGSALDTIGLVPDPNGDLVTYEELHCWVKTMAEIRAVVESVRGTYEHLDQLESAVFKAFDKIAELARRQETSKCSP